MKILLACPVLDIRYEWFLGFLNIWEQFRKRKNMDVGFYFPYRTPVHIADTEMVHEALKGNYDYILRMDDDIWDVPSDALERLLAADKDFISAVMYANSFPFQRCALVKKDKSRSLVDIAKSSSNECFEINGEGIQPVDLTAFPFVLWKTSLFKKIPEPWFVYEPHVPTDNYFCQKCLDHGVQPHVDMNLQVTHRGVTCWNRCYSLVAEGNHRIDMGLLKEDDQLYTAVKDVQSQLRKTNSL